jgi:2-polyprenyl-6-hydroxyphenyl methylase/3-demethylubiquinone-9 3-methyltransferase
MPVDNELYDRLSNTWWDESEPLGLLRTSLGPVRFGYFRRVLIEERKRNPKEVRLLDVGCGGGLLAEEFARLGCQVSGIDPSERSLNTARKHAEQSGLNISYKKGVGEKIPFADSSFEVVVCCDVLEHVNDVPAVLQESARVLATGGLFFYETINATVLSWLTAIKLAQEWKLTRFLPPDLHDWNQFVKPRELQSLMERFRLHNQEVKGMSPMGNPFVFFERFVRYRRDRITLGEMSKAIRFHESRNVSILYMGHALKE